MKCCPECRRDYPKSEMSIVKLLFAILIFTRMAFTQDDHSPLIGRWNLEVKGNVDTVASWLEIERSGTSNYVGRFVGRVGSARAISRILVQGNSFSFSIPSQWEPGEGDLTAVGEFTNGRLVGTIKLPSGSTRTFIGLRAPTLDTSTTVLWEKPMKLIGGRNLTKNWITDERSKWKVVGSILRNVDSGSNIRTKQSFWDFKLHLEFRIPKQSNSGVYLRGRYEVQIEDSFGRPATLDGTGALYGFLVPNVNAAKRAGEWQSMDITLIGRLLTVVLNGKTVICSQNVPGITGGSIDSREGEPGPLLLQGDHGPVEFRNVTIMRAVLKDR